MNRIDLSTELEVVDGLGVLLLLKVRKAQIVLNLCVLWGEFRCFQECLGSSVIILHFVEGNTEIEETFGTFALAEVQLVNRHLL